VRRSATEHAAFCAPAVNPCSGVNQTQSSDRARGGTAVAHGHPHRRVPMIMFKRSQLYIGFALAALTEMIIRVAVR
jgi:hypothetical protein